MYALWRHLCLSLIHAMCIWHDGSICSLRAEPAIPNIHAFNCSVISKTNISNSINCSATIVWIAFTKCGNFTHIHNTFCSIALMHWLGGIARGFSFPTAITTKILYAENFSYWFRTFCTLGSQRRPVFGRVKVHGTRSTFGNRSRLSLPSHCGFPYIYEHAIVLPVKSFRVKLT